MKVFKIALCVLVAATVISASLYAVRATVLYGDIRDYYPFGLWIGVHKLEGIPSEYTEIENDTYIETAIQNGNETWVHQQQSEYVSKGLPDVILYKGNYYRVSCAWLDGMPESFKYLPRPTDTASILAVAWIVLGLTWYRSKRQESEKTRRQIST